MTGERHRDEFLHGIAFPDVVLAEETEPPGWISGVTKELGCITVGVENAPSLQLGDIRSDLAVRQPTESERDTGYRVMDVPYFDVGRLWVRQQESVISL
jgi:hypothetical protein